jgi:hypothetical protein
MRTEWKPEWTEKELTGCTFVVVTSNHYWGIGKSLAEAAKNASVKARIHCQAYRIPNMFVKSVFVSEIDGGVGWTWSDAAKEDSAFVRSKLASMFSMGSKLKIDKPSGDDVSLVHSYQ